VSRPSNPLSQFVLKCAVVVTSRVIAAMSAALDRLAVGPASCLGSLPGAWDRDRRSHRQRGQHPDRRKLRWPSQAC
jgi:hypothetical protein